MEAKETTSETSLSLSSEHIELSPGICGGKARIAGTRIRVQDIYVWHELHGKSADEIVCDFPQLGLADVHAALTYYFDNRGEIQKQMKADDAFVEAMKQKYPSKLLAKLKGRNAVGPSVSP
jgi:uncharacterized protein (DUF433 family)